MRRLLTALALATTAAAAGCATTMTVGSHVERGLVITQFRTYAWGPADALPAGDPRLDRDPFFQDKVQGAVEKALASRGFEATDSGAPDLLIHYHASITQRLNVDSVDRGYGYCDGGACDAGVTTYEAGTLVLDVVDTRTNRLIWRGWAQDAVEEALRDRDKMARQIDEAVARMMANFPAAP
jgi:hypothetical protein